MFTNVPTREDRNLTQLAAAIHIVSVSTVLLALTYTIECPSIGISRKLYSISCTSIAYNSWVYSSSVAMVEVPMVEGPCP